MSEPVELIQHAERGDHQLVRAIGFPGLTANIVNATVGAGIFALPAAVASQIGAASPLSYLICAFAMVLFVTSFAMAGSRVSLTGGLYAYVEVAFGRYLGFLAGVLYFLTPFLDLLLVYQRCPCTGRHLLLFGKDAPDLYLATGMVNSAPRAWLFSPTACR